MYAILIYTTKIIQNESKKEKNSQWLHERLTPCFGVFIK